MPTRPDIAFPVQYLCRCMQRPTPELIAETDHVIAYLARHPSAADADRPGRESSRRGDFGDHRPRWQPSTRAGAAKLWTSGERHASQTIFKTRAHDGRDCDDGSRLSPTAPGAHARG